MYFAGMPIREIALVVSVGIAVRTCYDSSLPKYLHEGSVGAAGDT